MSKNGFDRDLVQPTIDAILSVADLNVVSAKRIRLAIQDLFDNNYELAKSQLNAFIVERYQAMLEIRKDNLGAISVKELQRRNKLLAASLLKEQTLRKRTEPQRSAKTGRIELGPHKDLYIIPKLREIINVEYCSRFQITKHLWEYIKKHDLQDPQDKRSILCDPKLERLTGKKKVLMFELPKCVSECIKEGAKEGAGEEKEEKKDAEDQSH